MLALGVCAMVYAIFMAVSYVALKAFSKILNLVELVFDVAFFAWALEHSIVWGKSVIAQVKELQYYADAGYEVNWALIAPQRAEMAFLILLCIAFFFSIILSFHNNYTNSSSGGESAAN